MSSQIYQVGENAYLELDLIDDHFDYTLFAPDLETEVDGGQIDVNPSAPDNRDAIVFSIWEGLADTELSPTTASLIYKNFDDVSLKLNRERVLGEIEENKKKSYAKRKLVIVIGGNYGLGKTSVAYRLHAAFGGSLVSADALAHVEGEEELYEMCCPTMPESEALQDFESVSSNTMQSIAAYVDYMLGHNMSTVIAEGTLMPDYEPVYNTFANRDDVDIVTITLTDDAPQTRLANMRGAALLTSHTHNPAWTKRSTKLIELDRAVNEAMRKCFHRHTRDERIDFMFELAAGQTVSEFVNNIAAIVVPFIKRMA